MSPGNLNSEQSTASLQPVSPGSADLVLGIDGGGSKTTALLADISGNILGRGEAGASNFQTLTEDNVRRTLIETVEAAFADARLPCQPAAILGLGLSGVDRPEDHARVQRWVSEDHLANKALVGNDSNLLLWAGTLEGWGIAVISGTGSIVYGRKTDGKTARAGGWGYRFGDEGSGFAIGTAALRAVAKAADGRGPQTMLTTSILHHWNLQQPPDLISHIYSGLPYPQIASLAKLVNHIAEQNDPVARSILMEAARELVEGIKAVYEKLDFQGNIPAALGGGVLSNSDLVKNEMLRLCAEEGIPLHPVEMVMQPVLGAVRMAIAALRNQNV